MHTIALFLFIITPAVKNCQSFYVSIRKVPVSPHWQHTVLRENGNDPVLPCNEAQYGFDYNDRAMRRLLFFDCWNRLPFNTVTNCFLGSINERDKPVKRIVLYYMVIRMPLAFSLSRLEFGLAGIWSTVFTSHIIAAVAALLVCKNQMKATETSFVFMFP